MIQFKTTLSNTTNTSTMLKTVKESLKIKERKIWTSSLIN